MPKITIVKVQKGSLLDSLLAGNLVGLYDYMGYFWLIMAIIFLFVELNTPGLFFFISFAIGSLCAAILAFVGYSFVTQCFLGLAVSIVSFLLMRTFLKKKMLSEVKYESAITNIDALIGKKGVVLAVIKPYHKGIVKIGGETWSASADGDVVLQKGATVFVLRVEGNTVIVGSATKENENKG